MPPFYATAFVRADLRLTVHTLPRSTLVLPWFTCLGYTVRSTAAYLVWFFYRCRSPPRLALRTGYRSRFRLRFPPAPPAGIQFGLLPVLLRFGRNIRLSSYLRYYVLDTTAPAPLHLRSAFWLLSVRSTRYTPTAGYLLGSFVHLLPAVRWNTRFWVAVQFFIIQILPVSVTVPFVLFILPLNFVTAPFCSFHVEFCVRLLDDFLRSRYD